MSSFSDPFSDSSMTLPQGDRGGGLSSVAGAGGRRRHFVVEADDGEAEEGNSVLGAEDAFIVHVDVEEFMERLDVANAAMVRAGANDAIEAGAAPGGAGRVQAKRAVGMSDRAETNIRAAIA